MAYKALDKPIRTGEIRCSYVNLLQPRRASEDAEPKYSVTLLIPKDTEDGRATIAALRAAQRAALVAGKDSVFDGRQPKDWDTIHDGDNADETDLDRNPEYAGHWYLSASTGEAYPPGVIDRSGRRLTTPSEVYSGMYARVSLTCFAYSMPKKKGVTFGLNSVFKTRDGEPLSGGRSAENEWDDLIGGDDESSAADLL